VPGALARAAEAERAREALTDLLEESTRYGDAGAQLPQLFLGVRGRIVNLSGLINAAQVLSLADAEMAELAPDERIMIVAAPVGA
jgi:N-methylhydantoinase A